MPPGQVAVRLDPRLPLRVHVQEAHPGEAVGGPEGLDRLQHQVGEGLLVLPWGDQEAVARHRGGRAQAHQLGVVAQAQARGHLGPGVVPDELPLAVALHVQRGGARQLGPAPHGQVRGQPAGVRAHAAGALQAGEPFPLQRRGGQRLGQRVPGLLGDLLQRVLPFHAVGMLHGLELKYKKSAPARQLPHASARGPCLDGPVAVLVSRAGFLVEGTQRRKHGKR